ncbi:MAG TPA: choice-of-anchor D domain-containing protein [Terriglobales bacterium]
MNRLRALRTAAETFAFVSIWGLTFIPTARGQTNPVPWVNEPLVPASILPGSAGFTLTVNGTGFVSGSVVNWNGSARTTTFVSTFQLRASIAASDVATAGTATVTVTSPGASNPSNFAFIQIAQPASHPFFSGATFATDYGPDALTVGDFNNDGKLDLAVAATASNTIDILLGNGDGTFQLYQSLPDSGTDPASIAVTDFNGDGNQDLLVANYFCPGTSNGCVTVFWGKGDGTFPSSTIVDANELPVSVVAADFLSNGGMDFLTGGGNGQGLFLQTTDGKGTFYEPSAPISSCGFPVGVSSGDFNRDGKLDLAVGCGFAGSNVVGVQLGNGDGTFRNPALYTALSYPEYAVPADFNGDGVLDLAVMGFGTNEISILLGNGDGTFQNPVSYAVDSAPYAIAVGDFNADGKLDVVTSSDQQGTFAILLGNGDGTFQPYFDQYVGAGFSSVSLAAGDFNNDGKLDLAVGNAYVSNSGVSVLLQTTVSLSVTLLNFGHVAVGQSSVVQTVSVTNNGIGTMAISGVSINGTNSGDFAESNECGSSLAAGASCTINVTFTPTAYGNRSAALSVTDGALGSPQSVVLSGFGDAPLVGLSATSVAFPQQLVGTVAHTRQVQLTNTGTAALTISGIVLGGTNSADFLESNNCPASLAAGAGCTISVAFRPETKGSLSAQVTVTDNAAGSPQTIVLTGTATFFQLSPASLSFGDQKVGTTSAPQTVTLTNVAVVSQPVTGIRFSGAGSKDFAQTNNCGMRIPAKSSCILSVTFTPLAKGNRQAALQIAGGGGLPVFTGLSGTGD